LVLSVVVRLATSTALSSCLASRYLLRERNLSRLPASKRRFATDSLVLIGTLAMHREVQWLPLSIYPTRKLNVVATDANDVALCPLGQFLTSTVRCVEVLLLWDAVRIALLFHAASRAGLCSDLLCVCCCLVGLPLTRACSSTVSCVHFNNLRPLMNYYLTSFTSVCAVGSPYLL
jgi:hypothetical protein